jgi:hypothetical protein
MTDQPTDADAERRSLEAGRAAGYCWAQRLPAPGTCTRPPGHDGDHVDYYNGRRRPTDIPGYSWPQ